MPDARARGAYGADQCTLLAYGPALVLTMAMAAEMEAKGAADLPRDLAAHDIGWLHLPAGFRRAGCCGQGCMARSLGPGEGGSGRRQGAGIAWAAVAARA